MPEEAFKREVLEEIGCIIEIIEKIEDLIYEIRGVQVMFSSEVAKIYQVETKKIMK